MHWFSISCGFRLVRHSLYFQWTHMLYTWNLQIQLHRLYIIQGVKGGWNIALTLLAKHVLWSEPVTTCRSSSKKPFVGQTRCPLNLLGGWAFICHSMVPTTLGMGLGLWKSCGHTCDICKIESYKTLWEHRGKGKELVPRKPGRTLEQS